jgi:hypothetical protein
MINQMSHGSIAHPFPPVRVQKAPLFHFYPERAEHTLLFRYATPSAPGKKIGKVLASSSDPGRQNVVMDHHFVGIPDLTGFPRVAVGLAGLERRSSTAGFDAVNSPGLLRACDVAGRTLVQKTTAGTVGAPAVANAPLVFVRELGNRQVPRNVAGSG